MVRLLICEGSRDAGVAVREAIGDGCEIVAEVRSCRQAVLLAVALQPDVVLLDAALPAPDGEEAVALIHELVPRIQVVTFGGNEPGQPASATVAAPAGPEIDVAVLRLTRAMEASGRDALIHARRVQRYALELARVVEPSLIQDGALESSFLLHDVGKLALPDGIVSKCGPLSNEERSVMRTHPILGEQMLAEAGLDAVTALAVARSHHERWDGLGYPDGLAGADIPLAARIVAVADALDAMTNDRPYRAGCRWEDAIVEIVAQAGTQFDRNVVDALVTHHLRLRRIHYELLGEELEASAIAKRKDVGKGGEAELTLGETRREIGPEAFQAHPGLLIAFLFSSMFWLFCYFTFRHVL